MQIKKAAGKDGEVTITVIASEAELQIIKDGVLSRFQSKLSIPGFRPGKAPLDLVEKNINQTELQSTFLEEAINSFYPQAIHSENLQPIDKPAVTIKKFAPFTVLEFVASVPVLGEVKLPDYKKMKKNRDKTAFNVTDKDVKAVIESLQQRLADKKIVDRPAKLSDEVWIDFEGTDQKGLPIKGADGKDYPLLLGSNTFIPGFEEHLVGMTQGESKKFDVRFPQDYGAKMLAGKKVSFSVKVLKVQEVIKPDTDAGFAAKAGPFKTIEELKKDIKNQLLIEHEKEYNKKFETEVVMDVVNKAEVHVPDLLINDQIERLLKEVQQNIIYRGSTYAEFLKENKTSDAAYKNELLRPKAHEQVKTSLVLAKIAEAEKLDVSPEELEVRMQLLKGQYQDPAMQAELEKPETRRDIASRILTEKVVLKLVDYAQN